MYESSDSDSVDSDEGIRFKTENVRSKNYRKTPETKLNYDKYSNNDDKKHQSKHLSSSRGKEVKHRRSSSSDRDSQKLPKYKTNEMSDIKYKSSKNNSSDINTSEEKRCSGSKKIMGPALPPHLLEMGNEEKLKNNKSKLIDMLDRNDSTTSNVNENNDRRQIGPLLPSHSINKSSGLEKERETEVEEILGPALPPHLMKKRDTDISASSLELKNRIQPEEVSNDRRQIGPPLPSDSMNKSSGLEKETETEVEEILGPALPPHLMNKRDTDISLIGPALPLKLKNRIQPEEASNMKKSMDVIGPTLPSQAMIGPCLPSHMQNKSSEEEDACTQLVGPVLPTKLTNESQKEKKLSNQEESRIVIGPTLPPHMQKEDLISSNSLQNEFTDNNSDEDEDVYGPLPPGTYGKSEAQIALEERALQLKLDRLDTSKSGIPVREEWMLTLPQNRASNLGLGPRQFRSKTGPDLSDRSCWTDTPEDKKKKKAPKDEIHVLKELSKQREIEAKDAVQEEIIKKHKRKNKQSLLEIHQEKLKKQKQEEGPSERRPFSRELDLQVNRFDEAQKKSVLKKAQLLDDRFARGQSKFI